MYLTGEKYFFNWDGPNNNQLEEGFELKCKQFRLGYWRKHPDLHGYIVQNFADGVDDCRPVHLEYTEIEQIITAVEKNELPKTTGFFFGESTNDDEEKAEAVAMLTGALQWLRTDNENRSIHRSVIYQASW